jgi:hypothetical protein
LNATKRWDRVTWWDVGYQHSIQERSILGWCFGSGSNKNLRLDGLIVDPIGVNKESFPSDKLSGQPSIGNIPITSLQPIGGIEEAGIINQSMSVSETLGFDSDFYPETSNSLVFFAGKIMDHT